MKRFIFWSTVLLALSGTMMGMAQENNVVIFDGDGGQEYIYKKKHKYYVLKEDGIADVASDLFKKNKRWAKKMQAPGGHFSQKTVQKGFDRRFLSFLMGLGGQLSYFKTACKILLVQSTKI